MKYSIILTCFILVSCSNNSVNSEGGQEIADPILKATQDSIKQVVADSIKQVAADSIELAEILAEANKVHLEKLELGKELRKVKINAQIDELKNQIEELKVKLADTKILQFGRFPSEREEQLRVIENQIAEISDFIPRLEEEKVHSDFFKPGDFQDSPSELVNHLFKCAKDREFGSLRSTADPYGDYDSDVYAFSISEAMTFSQKENLANNFATSRILNAPNIQGDKASIEIAVGEFGDRIETMNLVKRMDKWYFSSY